MTALACYPDKRDFQNQIKQTASVQRHRLKISIGKCLAHNQLGYHLCQLPPPSRLPGRSAPTTAARTTTSKSGEHSAASLRMRTIPKRKSDHNERRDHADGQRAALPREQ
jgi:hypothetical protein